WAVSRRPGVAISVDMAEGHEEEGNVRTDSEVHPTSASKTAQCAKIVSEGPVACLVSRPFAPPRTGRLAISVWLKVADAARQPNLRLAVETKVDGRDYYRFATIGQSPEPQQPARPIDAAWRRFIVPFNDLPIESAGQMRVRLDLMGAGQVWADDVQL